MYNPGMQSMEGQVIEDVHYDYHQDVATSCYGDMLHDHERNELFGAALKKAIDKIHARNEKAHVLDIGTGTGLLSMLAVRHGADSVVACEMFVPVAKCAKEIIKKNGLSDKIKVVAKHSTALTVGSDGDLPRRANILVSEVFDTELIGEGALLTFNHAHNNLLEEDSIVIPSVGTVFAQVVESKSCLMCNRLENWRLTDEVEVTVPESITSCHGVPALHDFQLSQLPSSEFIPLTLPLPIFRFDFMRQKRIPYNEFVKKHSIVTSSGTAHAVFMWWDLVMDDAGEIILSCAPVWYHPSAPQILPEGNPAMHIPWRDHWMQAVYFPHKQIAFRKSEEITLRCWHDQYSLWFEIGEGSSLVDAPVCQCMFHIFTSRTRMGALNDSFRRTHYSSSLRELVSKKKYFIVFGDFTLIGIAAAKLGATRVYVLSSASNEKIWNEFVVGNKLENIVSIHHSLPSIVSEIKEVGNNATWGDICLLNEPFYQTSLVAWHNIEFWRIKEDFLNLIRSEVKMSSVPMFVVSLELWACCVRFDDLHKINRPLGEVMGLDMAPFDSLIEEAKEVIEETPEPHPLWEYPCRAGSEPKLLLNLDVTRPLPPHEVTCTTSIPIRRDAEVDAVIIWGEYKLFNGRKLSTGPQDHIRIGEYIKWDRFERQGVHIFRNRIVSDGRKLVSCNVAFDPKSLTFNFSFYFNNNFDNVTGFCEK